MKHTLVLLMIVGMVTISAAGVAFAATTHCKGGTCNGTELADRIFGTTLEDVIYGGGGDDRIYGRGGGDLIRGEPGDDEIYGQAGNDKVKGGSGRDRVFGDEGDDAVRGSSHDDPDDGVRDFLDCGPGVDTVYFTPGTDVVRPNCEKRNP